MAAPVVLTVYCAFSHAAMELINKNSMVATSLFDVEFIPLKATVTASIEGALRRKASELAHRAAAETTTWCVLQLKFNAQQVCSMFLAEQLFHCRALDGSKAYRMYSESLRLNGDDPPVYCWYESTMDPTGLDRWAERFLPKQYMRLTAKCKGCNLADGQPVWATPNRERQQGEFCKTCWHSFYRGNTLASLHAHKEANARAKAAKVTSSTTTEEEPHGAMQCLLDQTW